MSQVTFHVSHVTYHVSDDIKAVRARILQFWDSIQTTIVVYRNSIDSVENLKSATYFRFSKISKFYIFEICPFDRWRSDMDQRRTDNPQI